MWDLAEISGFPLAPKSTPIQPSASVSLSTANPNELANIIFSRPVCSPLLSRPNSMLCAPDVSNISAKINCCL